MPDWKGARRQRDPVIYRYEAESDGCGAHDGFDRFNFPIERGLGSCDLFENCDGLSLDQIEI